MGKNKVETVREWRRANPDKMRAYKQKYHVKHRDEDSARAREYYEKNKEKLRAQRHVRALKDPEGQRAKARAYYAANPQKTKKWRLANQQRYPALWRFKSVRKQAKDKGLDFDLDLEWFSERLEAGVCELSGLPFDFREKLSLGGRGSNSPSVDRRDPKGPYTKANCRMILWWLNRAFSDLGQDYAYAVFRGIFIKRGEMLDYEDRMAA